MIINDREKLSDMFLKCVEMGRYHMEAAKTAAMCNPTEAQYHLDMADHYIAVRRDILRILREES